MVARDKPNSAGVVAAPRAVEQPKARRSRRASPTSEDFLDSALQLFLEHGFDRTSIDALAEAGGVAKRTVYLRYKTKKAIFQAALERGVEGWVAPTDALRAAETDDLEETLIRVGQILVDNALRPEGLRLTRLVNAVSGRMPDIGAASFRQGSERTLAYLKDLLLRHSGESRPTPEKEAFATAAAEAFIYLVVGGPAYTAGAGVVHDPVLIDARIRYSVALFLRGIERPLLEVATKDSAGLQRSHAVIEQRMAATLAQVQHAQDELDQSRVALLEFGKALRNATRRQT